MKATKRKLDTGKSQMFSLRNSKGEVTNNATQEQVNTDTPVPSVTIDEVRTALKGVLHGQTCWPTRSSNLQHNMFEEFLHVQTKLTDNLSRCQKEKEQHVTYPSLIDSLFKWLAQV